MTAGESSGAAAGRFSSGGGAAPEISPDGRWLAFARQIPDGLLEFKGHKYGPRTALWIRDMKTGAERLVMDPIEPHGARADPRRSAYCRGISGRATARRSSSCRAANCDGWTSRRERSRRSRSRRRCIARFRRWRASSSASRTVRVAIKFFRWPTATADGATIAFQAAGHIWSQDGENGAPRRLTPKTFDQLEFAPAWSPDGRSLAFVTWDDTGRGHVWKVPSSGGAPIRLTKEAGDYVDPVWSQDGRSVIVARGEGATARQRTLTHNAWYELVRISATPAAGGDTGVALATITRPSGSAISGESRRQMVRPSIRAGWSHLLGR